MIAAATPLKNLVGSEGIRTRVLVIDGEPLIRWALSVGLTAAGYDVVAAADAAEARAAAGAWPHPDVVLLDLHQTDCFRLLGDLKSLAPDCRILALGTCCDQEQNRRWQGLDVIAKPFDLADVVARVGAITREPHP